MGEKCRLLIKGKTLQPGECIEFMMKFPGTEIFVTGVSIRSGTGQMRNSAVHQAFPMSFL